MTEASNQKFAQSKAKLNFSNMHSKIRPAIALNVEDGVFVIVFDAPSLDPVKKFARYEVNPLPHLISTIHPLWMATASSDAAIFYGGYIEIPNAASLKKIKFGVITQAGKKILLSIECTHWRTAESLKLAEILKSYGRFLWPGFEKILPNLHPLRVLMRTITSAEAAATAKRSQRFTETAVRTESPKVIGHFDGIIRGAAHGWVYDSKRPSARLEVEIVSGEELITSGLANNFRDDLYSSGIGDGEYHFRLQLPAKLFDESPKELRARVRGTGEWIVGAHYSDF